MDGGPNDLNAIPNATAGDIEALRAALAGGVRRIARLDLSFGAVWIKRYGTERAAIGRGLRTLLARITGQAFLRPSPGCDAAGMAAREVRRSAAFAGKGMPVPGLLFAGGATLVLADAAPNVAGRLKTLRDEDPAAHEALLIRCASDLGALHAAGLCHGRPHPRDFFLVGERIGFLDFEEEPEAVMPLAAAQARDLWLLFLQIVPRALSGTRTADEALAAWTAAAPAEAHAELVLLVAFLAKFLWLTRLIGRVHMGSDLRRFLMATRYLSQVLPAPSRPPRKQSRQR